MVFCQRNCDVSATIVWTWNMIGLQWKKAGLFEYNNNSNNNNVTKKNFLNNTLSNSMVSKGNLAGQQIQF